MVQNRLFQKTPIQMGVNFRSRYRLVAQHFLNGSQIGASFDQMGGK